ncbi:hypothetical protein [Crossiella sp. NPDC003009]
MGRRSWTLTALVAVLLAALAGPAAAARELPVVYHSPLAVAASLAHPGSAPPGANDWSCRSATRMRINWHTLSPLLKNNGYCVFAHTT